MEIRRYSFSPVEHTATENKYGNYVRYSDVINLSLEYSTAQAAIKVLKNDRDLLVQELFGLQERLESLQQYRFIN
jgi:hypothetical protein